MFLGKNYQNRLKNIYLRKELVNDFEISHHYGLDKFNKFGLVMITILNRDYCKKILVLFQI